jgi:hypothetical protein
MAMLHSRLPWSCFGMIQRSLKSIYYFRVTYDFKFLGKRMARLKSLPSGVVFLSFISYRTSPQSIGQVVVSPENKVANRDE